MRRRTGVRLAPLLAMAVAVALYALLPTDITPGPRWLVPSVEVALMVALTAVDPRRVAREDRVERVVVLALVAVIAGTNTAALGVTVADVLRGSAGGSSPHELVVAALQIFATNVVVFALLYWELDRGGPVARRDTDAGALPSPDFQFPQDGDASTGGSDTWKPAFLDYLYLSFTNCTAYSPTDTMPLTTRVKAAMALQAVVSLLTTLIVVAKVVNASS